MKPKLRKQLRQTRVATTLTVLLTALAACSAPSDQMNSKDETIKTSALPPLLGTAWVVEDIDQAGIIDRTNVTIIFSEEGKVNGRASCNNYFATLQLDGNDISVSETGSTRMACPEALMSQENRFLSALQSATRLELESDTWLVFYDEAGEERLRATRMTSSDH